MAEQDRIAERDPEWVEMMSEPECHTEHLAALDATIFRRSADPGEFELVLELHAGKLHVRSSSDS